MTTAKPPNPPWRHHYVPRFLLAQWANFESKVGTYTKQLSGKITAEWRSPKSVGYEIDLYTFPELGSAATSIETGLMGKLDDAAAKIVHRMIETGGEELDANEQIWWSHFMLSLLLRGPESVKALKAAASDMWKKPDPQTQSDYEKLKGEGDPATIEEWLEQEAGANDLGGQQLGHKILHSLVMNSAVAEHLRKMHWFVVTTTNDHDPFLTSDRPIFMSNGIGKPTGQVVMPIGPRALFCAFQDKDYAEQVKVLPPEKLVQTSRQLVTVRARSRVFGNSLHDRDFVKRWLGYEQVPSMGEVLAKGWFEDDLPVSDPHTS